MKQKMWVWLTALCVLFGTLPIYADTTELTEGRDEIPYGETVTAWAYKPGSWRVMNEEQAAAASVPEGYSGYVVSLSKDSEIGMVLDTSDRDLFVSDILAITLRVWVPSTIKEVRLHNGDWVMRHVPTAYEEWIDITLTAEGDGFLAGCNMTDLTAEDGRLIPMNLGFRTTANGITATVYIDSVTFTLRESDTTAPVITYTGDTVVESCEGRIFSVPATAYDEYEERDIPLEYIWSDSALGSDGRPVKGEHTCTVRATDRAGNFSEITLTVKVGERDTVPPEICISSDTVIHALTGTHNRLDIAIRDNMDELNAVLTWSDGATDAYGHLMAGTHTVRIVATDLSGNTAEKTVTVEVSDTLPVIDNVICDTPLDTP